MSLSTPVGFVIFNRPDLTEKVFEAIAQAKPKQLFVIADGPRFPEENEKCKQARAVIKKIDWDCQLYTNFSDVNLGCGKRVSSGFSWVFSQVEEAIFLEDDTLPTLSFFSFCEEMLQHYRYDERIMHINGENPANVDRTNDSYYFSKYMHVWGWATWRRAWQYYDYHIKSWAKFKKARLITKVCDDPYEQIYWESTFDRVYQNPQLVNTWDYQWIYACWSQGGLAIEPNKNLVTNLGYNRPDSTHTVNNSPRANLHTNDIWNITHPTLVVKNEQADLHTFDYVFGGKELRNKNKLLLKISERLSLLKRNFTFQFGI
ncbi:MAG: glycosyltransferase family 2 protein [Calothrix sp. C42_A2020_038]|nr:glycosyltransferase family 2 protein [Calothrix sp. C42_A2020_038]